MALADMAYAGPVAPMRASISSKAMELQAVMEKTEYEGKIGVQNTYLGKDISFL